MKAKARLVALVQRAAAAILIAAVLALSLAAVPAGAAPKSVVSSFGNPTSTNPSGDAADGGLFNAPRGIAVNETGAGAADPGDIYVVDGSNNRIQQFSADGTFIRAWGKDVITGGGTGFEICTVASDCKAGVTGAAGGEFNSPQGIAVDQATGDVYVTEQTNLRVQRFDAAGNFQLMWGRDVLNPTGGTTTEVCTAADTVAPGCKVGTSGASGGSFASTFNGYPAVVPPGPANAGNVVVADPGNRRVQEFAPSGAFVRTFGYDVLTGGGTGFEICTVAADCKVAAASGPAIGQLGTGTNRVAVNSSGAIFTVEQSANFRVQKFAPSGSSLDAALFAAPTFAGGTSATTPTDIAVDPVSGNVLVTRATPAAATASCPSGAPSVEERRVLEFDSAGNLLDAHFACAGLRLGVLGLAVTGATGRIHLDSTSPPGSGAARVYTAAAPILPIATLDPTPVDAITATGASFHGHVDPTGLTTSYRFEYRPVGATEWTRVPVAGADAGPIGSNNSVIQTATGLEPNTEYELRLVASKAFNGGIGTSATAVFNTFPAPPRVVTLAAGSRTDTAAWLGGQVDPQHDQTSYWIEYSTDPALPPAATASFPASQDADAGSGTELAFVAQLVTGLSPGTRYYFRVVAENGAGQTVGGVETFRTGETLPPPPPGRGYEKVSPDQKNGIDMGSWGAQAVDPSGNRVAFAATFSVPGANAGWLTPLLADRDPVSGWSSEAIDPPIPSGTSAYSLLGFSPDLDKLVVTSHAALSPGATPLTDHLYVRDNSDGGYAQINPNELGPPGPATRVKKSYFFGGASSDWSHLYYTSEGVPQTADPVTGLINTYQWVDGETRLVGIVDPDGEGPLPEAPAPLGSVAGSNPTVGSVKGAISADGRRLFFHAIEPGLATTRSSNAGQLYVRDDQGTASTADDASTRISASQATSPDPDGPLPATFVAAETEHGSKVLFYSCEKLTDDSTSYVPVPPPLSCTSGEYGFVELYTTPPQGRDLYLYDVDSGALDDLTTADPAGADVYGVLGASDDLSRVYFAAGGDLAPGATRGEPNLYLWEEGTTRFIATLAPDLSGRSDEVADARNWTSSPGYRRRVTRTAPDGGHLLFTSRAPLTSYDNTNPAACPPFENAGGLEHANQEGRCAETYLYDAEADELTCLSCPEHGELAAGDSLLAPGFSRTSGESVGALPGNLAPDGSAAYFSTPQALVGADVNGRADVYRWSHGDVSLISSGTGTTDADFLDATPSGNDVFFLSRQQLVGSDVDQLTDVYDARVGGGFAEYSLPPCSGDFCQGNPTQPSRRPAIGSLAPRDGGQSTPPACAAEQRRVRNATRDLRRAAAGHRRKARHRLRAARAAQKRCLRGVAA